MTLNVLRAAVFGLMGGSLPAAALASCIVFKDRDFAGGSLVIRPAEHVRMIDGRNTFQGTGPGVTHRPDWNDRISSYKVGQGCTLFMWEDIDAEGFKLTRTGTLAYIGDRRNDKVSEAICEC